MTYFKAKILNNSKKVVKRLILQYQEYISTMANISQLEEDYICNPSQLLEKNILNQKKLLDQISNEMTFADPIIWIIYKHLAYQNTPKAINTLGDLRHHCEPIDYICTKRFKFLKQYISQDNLAFDLPLPKFYSSDEIMGLIQNQDFISQWQDQEYYIDNNQVAKWKKQPKT